MSEPGEEKPVWQTGSLWGVLAVLLVLGAVGSATFVYGLLGAVGGDLFGFAEAGLGLVVALLAALFMIGILYRVDRYRGTVGRRLDLFE